MENSKLQVGFEGIEEREMRKRKTNSEGLEDWKFGEFEGKSEVGIVQNLKLEMGYRRNWRNRKFKGKLLERVLLWFNRRKTGKMEMLKVRKGVKLLDVVGAKKAEKGQMVFFLKRYIGNLE